MYCFLIFLFTLFQPKFSDHPFTIASPVKGPPGKLIEQSVGMDVTALDHNDIPVGAEGAIRSSASQITKQHTDKGNTVASNRSKPRSSTRHNEKPESEVSIGFPSQDGRKDTLTEQSSLLAGESILIPVCKQEAGTLLSNIQERRVSIVGMGNTQIENLAKTISSLTGTDLSIVYKVLHLMSKENFQNIPTHQKQENLIKKDSIVHTSKQNKTFVHTTVAGPTRTNLHPYNVISSTPHIPPHSQMDNVQSSENLYHTLYPTIDTDTSSRAYSTHSNTNNYKLAAVPPYQVVSSHVTPINSSITERGHDYLHASRDSRHDNIYGSNDSMSSYSSRGSTYARPHMNLSDTISYTPNINFDFCCIGEKTTRIFKMFNSNNCWIQVHLHVVFFAYNGCEVR